MTSAFVFPGQGSQSVGMLADLADAYPLVGETFASASAILGYDLWERVSNGPAEALNATVCTQPAMLCAGVATWRVWRDGGGPLPTHMAGHSLGEYSALVCSGVLQFEDAVAVVAQRAQFMQDAVPEGEGAMAAVIGLDDAAVEEACARAAAGEVVAAVNYNAPGQVVVAGNSAAVARLGDIARELGARRVVPLPVSAPSHCELMRPAAQELKRVLADVAVSAPTIGVLHNAGPVEPGDADALRAALCRQLYSPVRWRQTIEDLAADGVDTIVECGPGRILTGLVRRTNKSLSAVSLHDRSAMEKALLEIANND